MRYQLLRVDLDSLPAAISESIRTCLGPRGFDTLSPELLKELGRNVAGMLVICFDAREGLHAEAQPDSDDDVETDPAREPTPYERYVSACDDKRREQYDERHLETLRDRGAL